jgi:hypothetical protein
LLNRIKRLVVVMETYYVFCEVGTGFLCILMKIRPQRFHINVKIVARDRARPEGGRYGILEFIAKQKPAVNGGIRSAVKRLGNQMLVHQSLSPQS